MCDSKELLTCPFCGGQAKYNKSFPKTTKTHYYQVYCMKCKVKTDMCSSRMKARKLWNRRKRG